jgi:hypothetical protein
VTRTDAVAARDARVEVLRLDRLGGVLQPALNSRRNRQGALHRADRTRDRALQAAQARSRGRTSHDDDVTSRARTAVRRSHPAFRSDGFGWPQRDGLKWPHLALVDVAGGRVPERAVMGSRGGGARRGGRGRAPRAPHRERQRATGAPSRRLARGERRYATPTGSPPRRTPRPTKVGRFSTDFDTRSAELYNTGRQPISGGVPSGKLWERKLGCTGTEATGGDGP